MGTTFLNPTPRARSNLSPNLPETRKSFLERLGAAVAFAPSPLKTAMHTSDLHGLHFIFFFSKFFSVILTINRFECSIQYKF